MRENFTSINVVIDRSGSMRYLTTDTLGGFNQFLSDQKEVEGEAVLTLCTFSTDYTLVHDCTPLKDVKDLNKTTYIARGGTALLDALGQTIDIVGKKLASMEEDERPSKVIFLVITDGQENSSSTFTKEKVAEMVKHQQDVYSWEFVFMGANIDSMKEGTSIGFDSRNTMDYEASSVGTRNLYKSVSKSLTRYRSSGPSTSGFFGNKK